MMVQDYEFLFGIEAELTTDKRELIKTEITGVEISSDGEDAILEFKNIAVLFYMPIFQFKFWIKDTTKLCNFTDNINGLECLIKTV